MAPTIDVAVKAVKAGKFSAENYGKYSEMKYGGSSMAPYGTFENKIPADLKDQVAKRQEEILAETFVVEVDDNQPKSTVR
jgi:basic membrane lipoprotein Med (substrate-binding protein (PBP1-ABC) superfamily)